jgi:hypothetical protein
MLRDVISVRNVTDWTVNYRYSRVRDTENSSLSTEVMLISTLQVTSHAKFKLPVCANSATDNRKIIYTKKKDMH